MRKYVYATKWLVLICAIFLLTSCGKVISNEEFDLRQGGPADEYKALVVNGVKLGFKRNDRQVIDDRVHEKSAIILTIKIPAGAIQKFVSSRSVETLDGIVLEYEDEDIKAIRNSSGTYDILDLKSGKRSPNLLPPDALIEDLVTAQLGKGLTEGASFEIDTFDLESQEKKKYKIVVGKKKEVELVGKKEFLTELFMKHPDEKYKSTYYVDDDSNVKKDVSVFDRVELIQVACDRDYALSEDGDIFGDIQVVKSPWRIRLPKKAFRIDYLIKPEGRFKPVSSDNQSFYAAKNGHVVVKSQPVELTAGVTIPYSGDDPNVLKALMPTDMLESDNELIVKLAKKAVGKIKDAKKGAKKIEAFVLGHLSKGDPKGVDGFPTALQTANARRGDCKGHAVLTAAMCRAVGIPARVVSGYRYVNYFAGHWRVFVAHAWTEAYIGGKWAGLDATRNTLWGLSKSYDASYIAMQTFSDRKEFHSYGLSLDTFEIKDMKIYRKK